MVFCGHCGYQLAPGDTTCPRCGAEVPPDLTIPEPVANNPTEMSQIIQGAAQPAAPLTDNTQGRSAAASIPQPLILGSANTSAANDATTIMNAPTYQPPQQVYPNYPQNANMGMYNYNPGNQVYYPADQSAVIAQLLASSRAGKTVSLLLILFGLLLLITAIIVFLLNQQGIIFPTS